MQFMEFNEFKDIEECVLDTEQLNNKLDNFSKQFTNIANKTVVENGKLYLVRKDGTKIDTGTTLPSNETGTDGREIELQKSTDYIQWRYVGDGTWNNLVELSSLKGADGDTGLSAYELAQQETGFDGTIEQWLNSLVGATPNLQIGTVETLESGSSATASITGTTENPLLNLGIPKDADGSGTGGSSDTWVSVQEIDGVIQLTEDKYQYCSSISGSSEIYLPDLALGKFSEIHFFFSAESDLTLILPNCGWQNDSVPTISAHHVYEFIFTYFNDSWLGGVIEYGSQAIA